MFEVITQSPVETQKLAKILAQIISGSSTSRIRIIGLEGDLGSGKTTFIQGFARGLGVKEKILSPTFVLIKKFGHFYHIDCYRLNKPKELLDLGFKKILSDPKNIIIIEWADKVRKILPKKNYLRIRFKHINAKERKINFT